MDTVDKKDPLEILDFYDERIENSPLFCKNPQLRAEVAEMDAAIKKALPSLKDFDSSNEPSRMLTREEMVADFYRNKPAFLDKNPRRNKPMTEDDIKFFTPPDDLDEVLDAKLGTDFVRRKKEAERKKGDGLLRKFAASPPLDSNIKNEGCQIGTYADNAAAHGDGFGTGPSRDERMMARLVKLVETPEMYFNPATGEGIYLEEGDCGAGQRRLYRSRRRTRSTTPGLAKFFLPEIPEEPEVTSQVIDLRQCPPIAPKSSNRDERDEIIETDPVSDGVEKGAMEKSTTNLTFKEETVVDDDETAKGNGLAATEEVVNATVPRACLEDGKQAKWEGDELSPHLLREVFEIRAGDAKDGRRSGRHSPLPVSSSSEFDDGMTKAAAEKVADSFEMNNRLNDAWDWVTAIPRAYYLEEGNLISSFRKHHLNDTLDFRILRETFRSSSFYSNTKGCSLDPSPADYDGGDGKVSKSPLPPRTKQKENHVKVNNEQVFVGVTSNKAKEKEKVKKVRVEPLNEIDPNIRPHSRDPKFPLQSEPPNIF